MDIAIKILAIVFYIVAISAISYSAFNMWRSERRYKKSLKDHETSLKEFMGICDQIGRQALRHASKQDQTEIIN